MPLTSGEVFVASLISSLTGAVGGHGVYAVFGLMALDAVFPAASELVMLAAGALAAGALGSHGSSLAGHSITSGPVQLVVLGLSGTIGYLVGAMAGWALGRYAGPSVRRHARLVHLTDERLLRAESWFGRFGLWAVLLGRLTPVIRSFVSIPAGLFRSPAVPYALLTLIGSAAWSFAFAGAGYAAGGSYRRIDHSFRYVEYAVFALVALVAVLLIVRRRGRTALDPAD